MILIRRAFIFVLSVGALGAVAQPLQGQDEVSVARRVAATAQLAAQEYRLGVDGGRIVARAEVEEARLFLSEARRSAGALPAGTRDSVAR
jgi:hypothetical protein